MIVCFLLKEYFCTYHPSPVGRLTLASDGTALCGLWIEGQRFHARNCVLRERNDLPIFDDTINWLDRFFAGMKVEPDEILLNPEGTPFRMLVWKLLCRIPYGTTVTYGELAKQVAASMGVGSMSAQAVGGAVGANPVSIIIPCHRVVGNDGSLVGYAGGLNVKKSLLDIETSFCF